MSTARTIRLCTALRIASSLRYQASVRNPNLLLIISRPNIESCFLGNTQGLQFFSTGTRELIASKIKMDMAAQSSAAPGPTPPPTPNPNPSPGSWIGVAVGIFATVILPFLANKMGTFLKLNQEVKAVVETAEVATEVIEKVAEEVEKLAEEVANQFPEGGKVQNAATFVENIAKETIKDAHLAEDVIEKVEEVEKEVESFVDPAIHQVNKLLKEANDHKN